MSRKKEGPPTARECLDMVVYLRRGLMTLSDRENHDPGFLTDEENAKKLSEAGKAWISDADDYVARLKPHAIDEALVRDEKRRAALEKTTETAIQMRDHLVAFINCLCEKDHKLFSEMCRDPRISEYAGSVGQFGNALADLDALTPTPKDSKLNTRAASGILLDDPYR